MLAVLLMPPLVACLVVRFKKGDRKVDVMRPLLAKAAATGRSQVVAVGGAQEVQRGQRAVRASHALGSCLGCALFV